MAGYIVLKLKKKSKYSSFFNEHLVNTNHYANVVTVEDYSHVWVEQTDRGGLCKVNDSFFAFLKEMEFICRKYLDTRTAPVEPLMSRIREDITNSCISSWQKICSNNDSIMLLEYIANLWLNIRVHSFAKHWADTLESKAKKKAGTSGHTKALRKTLKQIGTKKIVHSYVGIIIILLNV